MNEKSKKEMFGLVMLCIFSIAIMVAIFVALGFMVIASGEVTLGGYLLLIIPFAIYIIAVGVKDELENRKSRT